MAPPPERRGLKRPRRSSYGQWFDGLGMRLARVNGVNSSPQWEVDRAQLLGRRISELGLAIAGTRVQALVERLYAELDMHSISYRPRVYLSDQWGCPDGVPLIGVPFYLADDRLERIEAEHAGSVESDEEAMRYLRHEAGHAINYAFHLHERADFPQLFGDYARPYDEHYAADPLSRDYVRHILGWYAQKHPDEDFAETFAVWLTPDLDWLTEYAGWGALAKLEWMDRTMLGIGGEGGESPAVTEDDLPVDSMHWSIAEHYAEDEPLPLGDARQFDTDLRRIFGTITDAPLGEPAFRFLQEHEGELVARLAYWCGVGPAAVRSLIRAITDRARALDLRVTGLEAAALIELTAFGTAVVMHWRYRRVRHTPPQLEEQ